MIDPTEYRVVQVRSTFDPQWWRHPIHWWRLRPLRREIRAAAKRRKQGDPIQLAVDKVDAEVERRFLFGDRDESL